MYFAGLSALYQAAKALGFNRRKRILIDCMEMFHYHHIKPVVDRLVEEGLVNVCVLENERFSKHLVCDRILQKKRFIPVWKAKYLMFDLTISLDLYSEKWIPHPGIRVAAPHGDGMKANYVTSERLEEYDVVWCVGKRQEDNLRKYMKQGTALDRIGFIVTDQLLNPTRDVIDVRRDLQLKDGLPVVLYAPSWSSNPEMIMISEEILTALRRQDRFNVIVKPHPNLLQPEKSWGRDWRGVLSEMTSERFSVVLESERPIQDYMLVSDVMISDISSAVFEYLVLDRPILLHTNSRVIRFYEGQEYFSDIANAVVTFEHASELHNKLREVQEKPWKGSSERRRIAHQRYYNVGCAAKVATQCVYKRVGV